MKCKCGKEIHPAFENAGSCEDCYAERSNGLYTGTPQDATNQLVLAGTTDMRIGGWPDRRWKAAPISGG